MSTTSPPARFPQRSVVKRPDLLILLPVFYAVFAVGIFLIAWNSVHAQQKPAAPNPGPAAASSANAGTGQLDSKLDELMTKVQLQQDYLDKRAVQIDKRADDLERLIAEMTLGSSIYTILLGLFAYFSLKNIKDDAKSDLKKIEELLDDFKKNEFADFKSDLQKQASRELDRARAEFEAFRGEVRNDIPELYGMARALGVILDRIRRQVDISRNWTLRDSYEAMTDGERQTVLVAEMTIAGFDYFGLPASKQYRSVAAEIYLNLANFYAARSRSIGPDGKFNQADMKRALIYIARACTADSSNPHTLSQRAALRLVDVAKPGDSATKDQLEKAEADLSQSLAIKPTDIRALYNMAWIARRTDKLPRALELLTKIIDLKPTLEAEDRGRRIIDAYTNRACYRAISLNPLPPNAATDVRIRAAAALIISDCKAACEEGKSYNLKEYCRKGFTREFQPKGELGAIRPLLPAAEVDKVIACR